MKKISISLKNQIFNPLSAVATNFVAQAAVQNMVVGTCPKCKSGMSHASISNGDRVFWCATCCVASPLPDAQ